MKNPSRIPSDSVPMDLSNANLGHWAFPEILSCRAVARCLGVSAASTTLAAHALLSEPMDVG